MYHMSRKNHYQSAQIRQCKGIAPNGKRCHRKSYAANMDYCNKHLIKQIPKEMDFGGPGLVGDTWGIVADGISLWDLRCLYLTCRTLYGLFAVGNWLSKHPRYVYIKNKVKLNDQDDVSKPYVRSKRSTGDDWIFHNESHVGYGYPLMSSFCSYHPILYVVNSQFHARHIFRFLQHNDFVFESTAANLYQSVYRSSVKVESEHICSSKYMQARQILSDHYDDTLLFARDVLEEVRKKRPRATIAFEDHKDGFGLCVIYRLL